MNKKLTNSQLKYERAKALAPTYGITVGKSKTELYKALAKERLYWFPSLKVWKPLG